MIFLDTSGIYALADCDDLKHEEALIMFKAARSTGISLLTHNYVIVESAALIQRRLGMKQALAFLEESQRFVVRWVSQELHLQAVDYLTKCGKNKLSLVDAVSITLMRNENVTEYIGFDRHFQAEEFRCFGI